ncbi:hypothetical protein CEXT_498621 [Caerostris extrusa]|uniref:Uncharacterized protein n=1 Tax=Caerostris extrusa TaxID=172846 RepID=A0AAV4THJ8_CAEEX|nr:hypothetical protein CEXT_498621 [Caerostris extrusa]
MWDFSCQNWLSFRSSPTLKNILGLCHQSRSAQKAKSVAPGQGDFQRNGTAHLLHWFDRGNPPSDACEVVDGGVSEKNEDGKKEGVQCATVTWGGSECGAGLRNARKTHPQTTLSRVDALSEHPVPFLCKGAGASPLFAATGIPLLHISLAFNSFVTLKTLCALEENTSSIYLLLSGPCV